MAKPIRQGDVIVTLVENAEMAASIRSRVKNTLHDRAKTVKRKRGIGLVLAEGEVTGHHHRVSTKGVKMYEVDGVLYLDVPPRVEGAELVHDEHDTLLIGPGLHRVSGQREYVAPTVAPRRVYD